MSHHITQDHWQETSNKKKEYVQPDGFFASSLWRLWIKTKTTFALSMMEPWEILLICELIDHSYLLPPPTP